MPRPCAGDHVFSPKTCPDCYTLLDPSPAALKKQIEWQEPTIVMDENHIRVNQGAGGLGDALLGLCAVAGLRRAHPDAIVVYRVSGAAIPFCQHFNGWDYLQVHDWDEGGSKDARTDEIQLNSGYHLEMSERYATPRVERYARNAGGVRPELPSLRNPKRLASLGRSYAGCVVLAPFAASPVREWNLQCWLTLEKLLRDKGYRTVVIGLPDTRMVPFVGDILIGTNYNSAQIIGAFINACCVVAGDTGLAHLGGILRVPTIVLRGPQKAEQIYGFYPRVRVLSGGLLCAPCCGGPPFSDAICGMGCADIASISPVRVLSEVDAVVLPAIASNKTLLTPTKLALVRDFVRETNGIDGDLAEFGVYQGGTAKLILACAPKGGLYLFDTFKGQPEDDVNPAGWHKAEDFSDTSQEKVETFLNSPRVRCEPGDVTTMERGGCRFRFVHLDLDTFQATWKVLNYLRECMVPGGIILCDDWCWPATPGVTQAIVQFGWPYEQVSPHQVVLRF